MFISGSITASRMAPTKSDAVRTMAGSTFATVRSNRAAASSAIWSAISAITRSPLPLRKPTTNILLWEAESNLVHSIASGNEIF